jgi:branched-chain amino acid transport system substrate-binding protein
MSPSADTGHMSTGAAGRNASSTGLTYWAVRTERGIFTESSEFFDEQPELIRLLRTFDPRRRTTSAIHTTHGEWFRVEIGPAGADRATTELAATGIRAPYGITSRELDVLTFIARGDTNDEIAAELGLSTSTVRSHVEKLLAKLHVARRSALAAIAIERGVRRITEGSVGAAFPSWDLLPSRRPLVVGAVAPGGATGDDLRRGGELAVELLNRRGGVRDRPVELRWRTVEEDMDPVDALDGWAWGGVDAITYFHGAGSAARFLAAAAATEIPLLHNSHGTTAGAVAFRVCPGVDVYGTAFMSFVRDSIRQHRIPAGDGRVVVLGEDPAVVGQVAAGRTGSPIKGVDTIELHGPEAWRAAARELREDPPSAVLLASFEPASVDAFLREFEGAPFPSLLFGLWVPGTPELDIPPPEGFVWASNSGRPRDAISTGFEIEFTARFGVTPWLTAGLQFDMIGLAAHGWAGAERPDLPASVAQALRRDVYRGVNGGYYFGGSAQDCLSFPSQVSDASLGHPRLTYQCIDGSSRRIGPIGFADRKMRTPGWLAPS